MLKLFILSFAIFIMTGCVATSTPKAQTSSKTVTKKSTEIREKEKKTVTKKVEIKKEKINVKKERKEKIFQTVDKKDAILVQKGPNKEKCFLCGMDLVKYYKTNHAAKLDGKNVQYCSLHCLTEAIHNGAELENPMVVDVKSLKLIPVTEAFYVVGSDVKGTMTKVSKYAFQSLKDATAFQKKHGGKILDFYSAWQIAKKDFQ